MVQKRNSSTKSSAPKSNFKAGSGKVIKFGKRTIRALPVTWISLGLNAVLLFTFFMLIGWTHIHSFWFSQRLDRLHHDVCPETIAPTVDTKRDGNNVITTFYVTDEAQKSGCADSLINAAHIGDYLAHPEHAAADADKVRRLSGNDTLNVTQVRSKETGQLLAPLPF